MKPGWMVLCASLLAGCQAVKVEQPLTASLDPAQPTMQGEFWHSLAHRRVVSHDEAFHGLLAFLDGEDPCTGYEQRVAELRRREILPRDFKGEADHAMDRGTLAVALVKVLGWKGGLNRAIAGASPRYAFRTLQFRGVYPGGSPNQLFTGAEFVGVMGRVDDLRRGGKTELPAHVLPAEEPVAAETLHVELPGAQDAVANAVKEVVGPWFWPGDFWLATGGVLMQNAPRTRPATGPATTRATDEGPIKVTGVVGRSADVRFPQEGRWRPVRVGMSLKVGVELRTGPGSAIQMQIAPDQTLTLDRLGAMRVVEATLDGRQMTTDMETDYGRIRYSLEPLQGGPVEGAGLEHSSSVRSPNTTLAVRGTRVILFDQPPYVPTGVSLTGRAYYTNARGQFVAFGGRNRGVTRIRRNQEHAAATALSDSIVDPTVGYARSQDEAALVAALIARGAVVTFDRGRGINVVRGGTVPNDQQVRSLLPGTLNFVLKWKGNANLDLAVSNLDNEVLYPVPGLTRTRSGGRIAFDHQGGTGGGIEISYWPGPTYSRDTTAFVINHVSGEPARLRLRVYENGKERRIKPQTGPCREVFRQTLRPGESAAAGLLFLDNAGELCNSFDLLKSRPPGAATVVPVRAERPSSPAATKTRGRR